MYRKPILLLFKKIIVHGTDLIQNKTETPLDSPFNLLKLITK